MKKNIFICALFLSFSCVEELDLIQETSFESLLVIEATVTDEFGFQELKLTRSYALDAEGPLVESNAEVKVLGDDGSVYNFQENVEGVYKSTVQFSALPNVTYHLEITTSSGREYASENSSFTQPSQIDDLYVIRDLNENNEEGISIYVDAENSNNEQQLLRYEYEETYKIIAPTYNPFELIIQNEDYPYPPEVLFGLTAREAVEFFVTKELREEQELICYNTVASNEIFLVDTEEFEQNTLEQYRIRFISRFNYIMSHRYSILVRQYIQSPESHLFYSTLKLFSESESLLSQVQPGFLVGNIRSLTNSNEKVAGFFEVSSVDERRIYFNYADLFPGEDLPPYYRPCDSFQIPRLFQADPITQYIGYSPIQDQVRRGNRYFEDNFENNEIDFSNYGYPYIMTVFPSCGDCTVLGNNYPPDFWVE